MFHTIAFDADDTLWHCNPHYDLATERFVDLLRPYHEPEWINQRLYDVEMRNLNHYGYGIKSFSLSMIETAIELSEGRITGKEIQQILAFCQDMLAAPIELLPHVEEVVRQLSDSHRLMIITKGDLLDQESKIARSGLGDYFSHVEIVSRKEPAVYAQILSAQNIPHPAFVMIGNSLKSDVLPVVEIGGQGIHIPYVTTWAHELVDDEIEQPPYHHLNSIDELPSWVQEQGR